MAHCFGHRCCRAAKTPRLLVAMAAPAIIFLSHEDLTEGSPPRCYLPLLAKLGTCWTGRGEKKGRGLLAGAKGGVGGARFFGTVSLKVAAVFWN